MTETPIEDSIHRGARLLWCLSRVRDAEAAGRDPTVLWAEFDAVARDAAQAGDQRAARAADHILHHYGPTPPAPAR